MNRDAVFSLLLLVAVTAACSWFGSTEPSPSNPSSNANTTANTGTTTTTREDPAADIDAMADKFLEDESEHGGGGFFAALNAVAGVDHDLRFDNWDQSSLLPTT